MKVWRLQEFEKHRTELVVAETAVEAIKVYSETMSDYDKDRTSEQVRDSIHTVMFSGDTINNPVGVVGKEMK